MLHIYCDEQDFSALSAAFENEIEADADVAAEVVFVSGDEIKNLNKDTRGVDAVTDVLSYPSLEKIKGAKLKKNKFPADVDENGNLFLGSIAICIQRAKEQAEEYGHSFERELNYLLTHGLCHLLGYDHMTDNDKKEMREKEERVMARLNLKREEEV